jgi:twitching motility protein PilT
LARLHDLFRYLKDNSGSDLHLTAGLVPRLRVHGSLMDVEGWPALSHAELSTILREIVDEEQWDAFSGCGDLDFAYGLEGVARFRANYLRQENGVAAVFRIIPEKILSAEDLGLPAAVEALAHVRQGMVLITGPTGSGKSTTLAAIVDQINRTYSRHVVTIEDPVEFVHPNKKCILSQREVGKDTPSFAAALRTVVRQDADVVLVGEMRDLETIALAITAAEMGTLVFGTLHTNNASKTIDRLVDAFPAKEQPQIRTTLADSVVGIVSQQLLPTADGKGRVAAHEILLRTSGLPNVIREGNTPMLRSIIQGGRGQGMCSMDDALLALVTSEKVAPEVALHRAEDKARFQQNVQNLAASTREAT